MEFGVVGHDGLMGLDNGLISSPHSDNNPTKHKFCGSFGYDNGDLKATKVAKLLSDDLSLNTNNSNSTYSHLKHYSSWFGYCDEYNMLSFSSPKLENKNLQSSAFPFYQHPNLCYSKSSGYGSVNPSMHFLSGVRGPFTTSQWFELEQQALIYKYIIANEPIPSNLLLPIRRAFESAGFCNFFGGLLRPNTIGYEWSPFQMGLLSNTSDSEPGRCRRTDGKKWRCAKEAVPDQKYCERHINRGRHRSRKPVESTTTNTNTNTNGGPSNKDFFHSLPLSSSLSNRLMVNNDDNSHGKHSTSRLKTQAFSHPHSFTNKSQFSVSIPPSDFTSFSSFPTKGDTLSPLRLSRVLDSVETSLGVDPNSWETSMAGPLGEVLKRSTCDNSSSSSQLASSPNGVLHRTALGYFSNSSAGSSPRIENGTTYQ